MDKPSRGAILQAIFDVIAAIGIALIGLFK